MRRYVVGLIALLGAMAFPEAARAQTAITVTYAQGWNMAGGPPGTNFSAAQYIDSYGPNGYVSLSAPPSGSCAGFWAWFPQPTTVTLAVNTATTVQCTLQPGWNLVGNPFDANADIQGVIHAYRWVPSIDQYIDNTTLPPGSSAWVYATVATPITLVSEYTPPPTVLIATTGPSGPYAVKVGDTIELQLPIGTKPSASANPFFLQLIAAGYTGQISCVGEPQCGGSLDTFFWEWKAVQPGTTHINVAFNCTNFQPPCTSPGYSIEIDISP